MTLSRSLLAAALACALLPSVASAAEDIEKVMGSITAHAGERYGNLETVNGSIHVEAKASTGNIETVNGSVELAAGAQVGNVETVNGGIKADVDVNAGSLETVNGAIRVEGRNRVGGIETVNGSIFAGRGSDVTRDVETVNGAIGLVDTDVGGSVSTVNGDVTIGIDSHVRGGLTIEKPRGGGMGITFKPRVPRIVIGPGAVVDGPLVFKREVKLYVHRTARIGAVTGATAIAFDGPTAPKD